MTTHTPGPWVSSEGGETGYPNVETQDGYALAEMWGCKEQDYANALLMALAPEMFEALLALLKARKVSTEEFRRVSYSPDVQNVLDKIEELAEA